VDVALLPALRGRGIGSALLEDLTDRADAAAATITLHVTHGNPAQRLYERFGFRTVEDHPFHTRMVRQPKTAS
jgi:ribosomal protein S18 acetylase RimI-like enzyme